MASHPGEQLGAYRLTRLLGQGGFAEVYLAEHVHLGTQVAIKVLYGKRTAQDIVTFTAEAQMLARLSHPHILRVLDFGFEQTQPFLVMDYAPGGTLRDHYPSGSPVPFQQVISYTKQVASALSHAHANKLVHRDVKPENMLLNTDGQVLLSDFGIAAIAHNTASMKTIDPTGTVHYMAPEQIKGKPRPASDQYALAICVYEWICGEPPFQGETSIEIALRQLSDDPPSLCQRIPALPSPVEQIIFKALAKDPEQRFPDISAFAQALEQAALSVDSGVGTKAGQALPLAPSLELKREAKGEKRGLLLYQRSFTSPIGTLAWCPGTNFIASVSEEELSVWDTTTGYIRWSNPNRISRISWSPDGAYLAQYAFYFQISDGLTGRPILERALTKTAIRENTVLSPHELFIINKLDWSPNGNFIAIVGDSTQGGHAFLIWDVSQHTVRWAYFQRRGGFREAVTWSPDERYLLTGGEKTVQIFDISPLIAHGGDPLSIKQHEFFDHVMCAAWSPDGKYIAISTYIGTYNDIYLWEPFQNRSRACRGHTSTVTGLAWSPQSDYLVSGSSDQTVKIWSVAESHEILQEIFTYKGHSGEITGLSWSPEGTRIASASRDRTVQIWQFI